MKVTIGKIGVTEKTWNDKVFHLVDVEGDENEYSCWNGSVKDWKPGDEVDAEISSKETPRGIKYYIKAAPAVGAPVSRPAMGGRPTPAKKSDKEMALNCSTALMCKAIEKGEFNPKEIVTGLKYFYTEIRDLIKDE